MPSSARSPRSLELAVQLELLAGEPVEPAEVEVVAAGRQAGAHRVEVHPVAGRVDQHVAALERARRRPSRASTGRALRLAGPCSGRPPGARRRRGRAAQAPTSSDSARSRTIAGAIVPPAPSTATLSLAHSTSSRAAQRQPELDPVARAAKVAAGQLLDAADAVAQRVAVAEELARRRAPTGRSARGTPRASASARRRSRPRRPRSGRARCRRRAAARRRPAARAAAGRRRGP